MLTADPKGYGSNWYATTRVDSPVRPRLSMELDVEVCVIGGGLAGLTVAFEVARFGWSVVLLEAKSVGWSASGRNSGVVVPGFGAGPDALIDRVGMDAAKALWARSEAGAEYVRNAARIMPGADLNEGGWLHVSKTDRTGAMAHEAALLAGEFGAAVEPWPADRVSEALHSPQYFHGLYHPRGFSLHPLNYALGLAAAAEAYGVRIFEDTTVLEIDPAGVRKRVVTDHARIRAAHVVLAGSVHMSELAPQFTRTLLPVFDTVVITAPLGSELAEAIRFPGAVSDQADPAGHHYRVVDGQRLMWCGQSSVDLGNPQRQGEALLRQIRSTYPTLSGVKAEHAWIGVSGRTVHGMPQIGEITPGLWLLSGFGTHGLNTTAMGAEMLAQAIVHNDRAWEMFSPFPLVWAGGSFGRTMQRVSGWSSRMRGTLSSTLSRRRRTATARRAEAVSVAQAAAAASAAVDSQAVGSVEPAMVRADAVAMESRPGSVLHAEDALLEEAYAKLRAAAEVAPWIPEAPGAPVPAAAPVAKRPKRGPKKRKSASRPVADLTSQPVESGNAPADADPPRGPGGGSDQPQSPIEDKKT